MLRPRTTALLTIICTFVLEFTETEILNFGFGLSSHIGENKTRLVKFGLDTPSH